jgi:hypothetical protein
MLDTLTKKQFLYWLKKRLINKYHETDNDVLDTIDSIVYNYVIAPTVVNDSVIDEICCKYFDTFLKDDEYILRDIFGGEIYSEQQEKIRSFVISMISKVFKSQFSLKAENNQQQEYNHSVDEFSFL